MMINSKDQEQVLIRPTKGRHDPDIGPDVIMIMIAHEIRKLAKKTKAKRLLHSQKDYYDIYEFQYKGKGPIYAMGPFMGAPHAVIGLEKAIALGGRRFWVMGFCGSLQEDLRIGDLVVPVMAYPEEGTSAHYPLNNNIPTPDPVMTENIIKAIEDTRHNFRKGPIWTTDAPFRETPEKVKHYQGLGVIGVEMELSALMRVAMFRKKALAGLLVVSDELFELKWKPGFRDQRLKDGAALAIRIILDTMVSSQC
jgi:uridine phosphorylase